jgi:HTH-type transcriptional regulator/antitoxin HipB
MYRLITSPQALGALIRDARKEQGLTQIALGKMTGLNQTTLSMIEKGKPSVQLQTILILLAALKLNMQAGSQENRDPAEDRW